MASRKRILRIVTTFGLLLALSLVTAGRADDGKRKRDALQQGVIKAAMDTIDKLATLEWETPWFIKTADGVRIDLRAVDPALWGHIVREAIRLHRITGLLEQQTRTTVQGLAGGVDWDATRALLFDKELNKEEYERGVLRGILAGAQYYQEWYSRANGPPIKPNCPFCSTNKARDNGPPEDLTHLFWRCTAFADIRVKFPCAMGATGIVIDGIDVKNIATFPGCLATMGILPMSVARQAGGTRTKWLKDVHRMMIAIAIARTKKCDDLKFRYVWDPRKAPLQETPQQPGQTDDSICPWGWKPPDGPRSKVVLSTDIKVLPFMVNNRRVGRRDYFMTGPAYYHAVRDYFANLEWPDWQPDGVQSTVSWIELLIDFETKYQMLIPPGSGVWAKAGYGKRQTKKYYDSAGIVFDWFRKRKRWLQTGQQQGEAPPDRPPQLNSMGDLPTRAAEFNQLVRDLELVEGKAPFKGRRDLVKSIASIGKVRSRADGRGMRSAAGTAGITARPVLQSDMLFEALKELALTGGNTRIDKGTNQEKRYANGFDPAYAATLKLTN